MTATPAQSTIIRTAIQQIVGQTIAGGRPGRVESYDPVHQRANVQPLVFAGRIDPSTDERVVERHPVLTDVPVIMLGTTRARTTMDIRPGDTVWIVASWFSLDRYLIRGGEVDPENDQRHALTDAVCFPAVFDFTHVPADASTDGMVSHATKLRLGGADANDPGARKSDLDALSSKIDALITAVNNHAHPTNGSPPSVGTGGIPVSSLTHPTGSATVFLK